MQNVKPVQRLFADDPAAQQQEPGVAGVGDQVEPADVQQLKPGPSCPRTGVARAMFEPTVMAQIAN